MIVDPGDGPSPAGGELFDVCIAGGGVAGITLAVKLAAAGRRALLIEAGGLSPSPAAQARYRGQNTGVENLPLHETRISALGGSSNHWGGWCRPFDAHDFMRSDIAPGGAWPISADDLQPHLDEALAILATSRTTGANRELVGSERNLRTLRMDFSVPPVNLGERYRAQLAREPNIVLVLNTAVTGAAFDAGTGTVASLTGRSATGRAEHSFRARLFVLAMGAIENVRTLLIWNGAYGDRIGNQGGMLGRYYMQHLHQVLGQFVLLDDALPGALGPSAAAPVFFASTQQFLENAKSGAIRLYTSQIDCADVLDDFRRIAGAACSRVREGGQVLVTCEQTPSPGSRILLTAERDDLGRPRVQLDWTILPADVRTMQAAAMEFGRYLVRSGLGRMRIEPRVMQGRNPLQGWTALPSASGAAGHQMGGARMSHTAADGVVDRDCRVWGTQNLYVAGAAVFRTGSQATPTTTIVQLALRLAVELNRVLGRG
jgi:choline dehydrogenase-like flavoprotein